jgi:hypothetical protein
MVSNLLARQKKKKRELTEKQSTYLAAFIENGGNNQAALREAGYAKDTGTAVMRSLSSEIIDAAQQMLAANSMKATMGLINALDDDGNIPRAELKVKAAESILNRVGLGKKETVEHNVTALHGVVLLPNKAKQEAVVINHEDHFN